MKKNKNKKWAKNLSVHDQTYCHTASLRPEYAQDMLRLSIAPDTLKKHFHLLTMQRKDTALHTEGDSKVLADVAYALDVGVGLRALVTLLILEHKSINDLDTPLQLAKQVTRAYKEFKHVVPIIFSHAREAWKVGTHIKDDVRQLIGLGELCTPYLVIDLNKISDERLLGDDLTAAAVWGTMKYRYQLVNFDQGVAAGTRAVVFILRLLRRTKEPYRAELFSITGEYMQNLNSNLNVDRLGEIERDNLQPGEAPIIHKIMDFDPVKARIRGHKEGRKEGHKEGRQEGVAETQRKIVSSLLEIMKPDEIAQRCEVPLEVVFEIQKKKKKV